MTIEIVEKDGVYEVKVMKNGTCELSYRTLNYKQAKIIVSDLLILFKMG